MVVMAACAVYWPHGFGPVHSAAPLSHPAISVPMIRYATIVLARLGGEESCPGRWGMPIKSMVKYEARLTFHHRICR
ncbi:MULTISPECIES: hypothetical protein [unclassified Nonomuraea]|uniref:hypothetical protein n=1 Tax=unclassified Nonomuraea TaxID=2593643 RepID=UPI0033EE89B7